MTNVLNVEIYNFLFVFLRLGSAMAFMPGFNSSYVNMRTRLSVALAVTVVLIPFLSPYMPPLPKNFPQMIQYCIFEVTYGAFLGLIMQVFYSALTLVGNFAGQSIGFSNAQIFDPTSQTQSIVIDAFLSMTAITIIFITDLHHLMLSAVIDSYNIFPAGSALPTDNFSEFFVTSVNKSFITGFKIASPFIAFMIIFYSGLGLVSRLMPQLNIFFLSLPLQIYLGLGLLLITTPVIIMWFLKYYEDSLEQFVR